MAENAYTVVNSGQEVQQGDVTQLGVTGGLADDHTLAELLRMAPLTGGTVAKVILPYKAGGNTIGTVSPSGSANGSIVISPFRAVVGSRNAANGAPVTGNITTDSDALANWRDIRSGVYVGTATTLTQTIALSPNSSGNPPRWDLVYASVTPDTNGPTVSRRVKNPVSGAITVVNVPEYIYTPVTVAVVTGTPGSPPALPTLPADGAGIYNIPLAYVRVPSGFSSSTTISTKDIRSTTQSISGHKDISADFDLGVANGNNDENTNFNAGGTFPWVPGTAGSRPGPWMPPDWRGGTQKIAQVDNLTPGTYSHASLAIIDSSIDWRKRFLVVFANYGTQLFGTDPTVTVGAPTVPYASSTNGSQSFANTLNPSTALDSNSSVIWTTIIGGVTVGLLVESATGNLVWYTSGAVGQRFAFWIMASGQMPNL